MTLAGHLERHHRELETLLALLGEERELLGQGRVDGGRLIQVAERKQQALGELERFETQRRRAQSQLGYADDPDGDEQAARDTGCQALWQAIRDDAEHARRLNQFNGGLISLRLEGNQQLLDAMQKMIGQGLYGPDGQPRGTGGRLSSQA